MTAWRDDRTRRWLLVALLLLSFQAVALCWRMDRPWTYNDDYNGAFWSQAAHNLLRAGFAATAGVPAPLYFGAPPIPADDLYVHHPTLLVDLAAIDRALLGGGEAAARALPICFSLLTSLVLWTFAASCAGARQATLSLALFISAPMELHYGQMVNFEAPELFFLLAGLASFYQWRREPAPRWAAAFLLCLTLGMWLDWLGYLLTLLLAAPLLLRGTRREKQLAAALLGLALISGAGFLLQIRLANPDAWNELLHAFRERSGRGNLAGSTFTVAEWARTQVSYLAALYHPLAWLLALAGAGFAILKPRRSPNPLVHTAAVLFAMDAIYVGMLRNQSFIHDFAGFYFLAPVAIFGGLLLELLVSSGKGHGAWAVSTGVAALLGGLLYSGVHRLPDIDTQFLILDGDRPEPALLMPDLGRCMAASFDRDRPVLCNFDPYYSPLPYYAQRPLRNNLRTPAEWESARMDGPAGGGVIWMGSPGAVDLLAQLPAAEVTRRKIDGIPFAFWKPHPRPR